MNLIFDHTKEKLSECMGMPESQVEELKNKLANITAEYAFNGKKHKSKTVEKIAEELSYNELLFISMGYIESIIDREEPNNDEPFSHLKTIIRKLRK